MKPFPRVAAVLLSALPLATTDVSATAAEPSMAAPAEGGCSPGFWKNHVDQWPAGHSPDTLYATVFTGLPEGADGSSMTLLDALRSGGGGPRALARHSVAALLASLAGRGYPMAPEAVIATTNAAYASGDPAEIDAAIAQIAQYDACDAEAPPATATTIAASTTPTTTPITTAPPVTTAPTSATTAPITNAPPATTTPTSATTTPGTTVPPATTVPTSATAVPITTALPPATTPPPPTATTVSPASTTQPAPTTSTTVEPTTVPGPSSTGADPTSGLPPVDGGLDYQLGGPYPLPAGVAIVARDRTDAPAAGAYNICYVNGFQTQPGEEQFWLEQHADLVLRHADGTPVVDEVWGEMFLDASTTTKREALAAIVGDWIAACADSGFTAVAIDNLDSYTRSSGLVGEDAAIDLMRRYAEVAHANGLMIAQQNAAEIASRRAEMATDFVVAEECSQWNECDRYVDAYGTHVLMLEYDPSAFEAACAAYGATHSITLRDVALSPPSSSAYRFDSC